jgi:O-antigen ligase
MANAKFIPVPAYLFFCILLGGASNGGFLANALLQVAGALILIWAFWGPTRSPISKGARPLAIVLAIVAAVMVLQFVPLPGVLWEFSSGRADLAREGSQIGLVYSPKLWGLLPYEALKSAIWALPALAIGAALMRLPYWKPQHLALVIVAAMVLSVVLGAAQLAQGIASPAYFYDITNRGSTVGFFANSNHLATLLLLSLPFIAALVANNRTSGNEDLTLPTAVVAIGLLVIALAGIAVNGSIAGFGLVGPVLVASVMILVTRAGLRKAALVLLPLVLVCGIAWMILTPQGQELLAADEVASSRGGREFIWAKTLQAIADFMPFGSGLGTFAEVFPRYEDPLEVADVYINHAHNDYLELLLEFGVLIVPLLIAFLAWWGLRFGRIWLADRSDPFALAGAIGSAAILVHSVVDYPLRTAAVSSIFAACLCMMASRTLDQKAVNGPREPEQI